MGAVLLRFRSKYAPLPRLFRGCFADLPDAPAVLEEFPLWPDRDGSDRFKSVGICATVSLLAHDTEAPATEVFLAGYSVGTLSTAIIENMLRECGNEEIEKHLTAQNWARDGVRTNRGCLWNETH